METLETTLEIDVDCEGSFREGTKAFFDPRQGQWYPGEYDSIESFKVFILRAGMRLEITDFLTYLQLEKLKNEFRERCK